VYGLASQWTQVHADLAKLAAGQVAARRWCVIAGLGWHAAGLAGAGSPTSGSPARCLPRSG